VSPVSVLIVDDSTTVRAVLRRVLESSHGIAVVGEAADGNQGVAETLRLQPDVVIMDLDLPGIDGYTATAQIMARRPTPIVVVTSRVKRDEMRGAFEALKRGAVAVFPKPEVPEQWAELGRQLPETVRQVGSKSAAASASDGSAVAPAGRRRMRVLAIGASTGGPGAVCALLKGLGRNPPIGIAIVQHIAAGFEGGFADWLGHELDLDVGIASDGEVLRAGTVRIAEANRHLLLDAALRQRLDGATPPLRGHRPSVNVLFKSLLGGAPEEVAAVLLTGMGDDGAEGMLSLRHAGALTIAQNQASCAVYGMPRAALESGAADVAASPPEIGRMIANLLRGAGS